jgi:5-methylcytosine-specific restriction protein A
VRREFTDKIKLAAWDRCGGLCEKCRADMAGRRPEYDHILADAMGGEPILSNCQVLCSKCHRLKTSGEDVPRIAKTKRTKRKTINAWPTSRNPIRSKGFEKRYTAEVDPDT